MATCVCFGCGNTIPEGLKVFDQYLCPDCELKIIGSDATQNDYQYWIDVLRKFWESTHIDLRQIEPSK